MKMSEKYIPRLEQDEVKEKSLDHTQNERLHKQLLEQAEKARHDKSKENIAKIQELAKHEAEKTHKITSQEDTKTDTSKLADMHSSLKANAYSKILSKTQLKLSKSARTFSKFTHSPTVDRISIVSAQTIARPSGFLGGGIFAFLGSATVYYFSKHYGYKYNYLLVFMFFVGGYIVGALLELFIWLVHSRNQRY